MTGTSPACADRPTGHTTLASDEAKSRNWIAIDRDRDRDRDGRISRAEFGLVSVPSAAPQPSAAAGASSPKKE